MSDFGFENENEKKNEQDILRNTDELTEDSNLRDREDTGAIDGGEQEQDAPEQTDRTEETEQTEQTEHTEETKEEPSSENSLYHYVGDPYGPSYTGSSYTGSSDAGSSYTGSSYTGSSEEESRQNTASDSETIYNTNNTTDNNTTDYSTTPGKNSGGSGMGRRILRVIGAAVIFGVVAGVIIAGINVGANRIFKQASSEVSTVDTVETSTAAVQETEEEATGISAVVDSVLPSVVSITCKVEASYYGFGTQESEGAGSGFILAQTDDELMIATNNHVVEDAKSLTVGFIDDTTVEAELVGTDSDADLAVISVKTDDLKEDTLNAIKIAVLGSSDDAKVGETVIAIGNALGYGQSVTTGVISAKNREVSFTDGTMTLMQTDAAINPGNSGGVLVNLKGEVIGINNSKVEDTSVEGMGYAIPISTAETILNDLINTENIPEGEAAFLGIVGRTLDSTYSEALGMPEGIYVSQVVAGSPAEEAGISAGDVITGFEGNNVSTMDGLKEKISMKEAGTDVSITLQRANQNGEYEEQTVTVTLGKESDYEDAVSSTEEETEEGYPDGSDSDDYYYYYDDGSGGNGYYNPFYYYYYGN